MFCEWETKLTSFGVVRTKAARPALGSAARVPGRGMFSVLYLRSRISLIPQKRRSGWGSGPRNHYASQAGWGFRQTHGTWDERARALGKHASRRRVYKASRPVLQIGSHLASRIEGLEGTRMLCILSRLSPHSAHTQLVSLHRVFDTVRINKSTPSV